MKGISEGRTTIKKPDELPTGTYFYLLDFTDDQGKNYKKDNAQFCSTNTKRNLTKQYYKNR